jgi:hypothetical protein
LAKASSTAVDRDSQELKKKGCFACGSCLMRRKKARAEFVAIEDIETSDEVLTVDEEGASFWTL